MCYVERAVPNSYCVQREKKLRVDINAELEILSSACFKHEVIFAQMAPNPLGVEKEHDVLGSFSTIARSVFCIKKSKSSELCLPERIMVL